MQGRPHLVPYRPVDATEHPRSCGHCTQADAPLYHNANMEFSVLIGQRSCCLVTTHTTVPERSTMGSNVTAKGLSRIPRQSTKSLAARLLHPAGKQSSWQSLALVPRTSSSLSATQLAYHQGPSVPKSLGQHLLCPPTACAPPCGMPSYGLLPVEYQPSAPRFTWAPGWFHQGAGYICTTRECWNGIGTGG